MNGAMEGFFIKDSGIYARLFRPEIKGPVPLVVVFHGIPGNETNQDIAYMLRDEGYAVLAPHYNGCWGSKGDYRIENIPGNVKTVLDYVYDDAFASRWAIDTERVGVLGHSLGGWATLIAPKINERVRGFVALDPLVEVGLNIDNAARQSVLSDFAVPLVNVTAEQLAAGLRWAAEHWHPMKTIEYLGDRYFALFAASGQGGLSIDDSLRLFQKAKSINPAAQFWAISSDHSFVSQRPALRDLVVGYIMDNL